MSAKVKICARLRPKLPQEVDDGGINVEPHSEGQSEGEVACPKAMVPGLFYSPRG
jgi:hypothetical protein